MARIAILVAEGFNELELEFLRNRFAQADHKATIVGPSTDPGYLTSAEGNTLRIDATCEAIDPLEFCGAILPDGRWPHFLDDSSKRFLRVLHMAGRPIAAHSGGIRLLVAAGIGRGCTLSASESDRALLEEVGAKWTDATISTYGHVISARGDESLEQLMTLFLSAVDTFQKQTPATEFLLETRPPA